MVEGFIFGITLTFALAAIVAVTYGVILALAFSGIVFTFLSENRAIPIVTEGNELVDFLLAGRGLKFLGGDDPVERWTVIPEPTAITETADPEWLESLKKVPLLGGFLRGVVYYGLPPLKRYEYRFTWTSREQQAREGSEGAVGKLITKDEMVPNILVIPDNYACVLDEADLRQLMPYDLIFVFKATVVNPYKALFKVERWLEFIINEMLAEIRTSIANMTPEALNALRSGTKGRGKTVIVFDDILANLIKRFFELYGVKVEEVSMIDASPSKSVSDKVREGQARVFTATQNAKAIKIEAEAEKDRVRMVYAEAEDHQALYAADKLAQSNITTVAGGGTIPALAIQASQPNTSNN